MSTYAWEKLIVGCAACLVLAVIGVFVYIKIMNAPLERLRDRFVRLEEEEKGLPFVHVVNAVLTSEAEAEERKCLEDLRAMGPIGVNVLVEYLESPSPWARMYAADCLGALRDGNSVGGLAQALYDSDADVVYRAARALGKIGGPKAGEALLRKILSCVDERTVLLSDNYGRVWPSPHEAPGYPVYVCAVVAEELGNIRYQPAVGPLVEAMKAGNSMAARALGMLGCEEAIPALRSALSHSNEGVRASAVRSLARLHDREAIPPIRKLLDDKSDLVQGWVRKALRELDPTTKESSSENGDSSP